MRYFLNVIYFYPLNGIQVCSLLFQPVHEFRVCILSESCCRPLGIFNKKQRLIHLTTRAKVVVFR